MAVSLVVWAEMIRGCMLYSIRAGTQDHACIIKVSKEPCFMFHIFNFLALPWRVGEIEDSEILPHRIYPFVQKAELTFTFLWSLGSNDCCLDILYGFATFEAKKESSFSPLCAVKC